MGLISQRAFRIMDASYHGEHKVLWLRRFNGACVMDSVYVYMHVHVHVCTCEGTLSLHAGGHVWISCGRAMDTGH